jgi:HD-GYP domain-containing protein (c-di-GMP phosphodiesterase class II)
MLLRILKVGAIMQNEIHVKEFVLSLVKAIDSYNYLLKGHHSRTAIIASLLAKDMNVDERTLSNLVLAASIHDIGALHVDEVDDLLFIDAINTEEHEQVGSSMLSGFEPLKHISNIIAHHHIEYDNVDDLEIPIECYYIHLADRIDVLSLSESKIDREYIQKEINERFGRIFHPMLKSSFNKLIHSDYFWSEIENTDYYSFLIQNIANDTFESSEETILGMAKVFGNIVDYKSEWTRKHSETVSVLSDRIAEIMKLSHDTRFKIKVSGFLHDIGKIAIPIEIIDKEERLTDIEFHQIQSHAYYSSIILSEISGIEDISKWASFHHEKRDGSGYPRQSIEDEFSIEMDIVAFSDIFAALTENRPYREAFNKSEILWLLGSFTPKKLSDEVFHVIEQHFDELYEIAKR